jgi:hypothetical protein
MVICLIARRYDHGEEILFPLDLDARQIWMLVAILEGTMQTISSDASASRDLETVLVDLALQGGGSHGAFTWASSIGSLKRRGCGLMAFPVRRLAP